MKFSVSVLAALSAAIVLTTTLSAIRFSYLDALFLDLKNYLTAPRFHRNEIVSINVSEFKKGKPDLAVEDLNFAIRSISQMKPNLILVALGAAEIRDVQNLAPVIDEFPNIYLFSKWGDESAFSNSILKDHPKNLVLKQTIDSSLPPFDHKTRRFVLSMEKGQDFDFDLLKFNSVIPMFDPMQNFGHRILMIYDTKQVNLHYYRRESIAEMPFSMARGDGIEGRTVILTTNDNHSENIKHPYTRFSFSEDEAATDYFSYGEYLLNVYGNLKDHEYVFEPSKLENFLWILFFCFCNGLLLLTLRTYPIRYIAWSFLAIPLEFLVGLGIFQLFNINFDFSRILVSQLLTQYVGFPILLINYLRKLDAEKIDLQKKAVRDKTKMKFSVKVAEAEVSMKVAARVSHDLRSPIMALQIASEQLKGKIDEDVGSLIAQSTARIRHIADDTLKQYKNPGENSNTPLVNVREVLAELVDSYRHVHPQIDFLITEHGFYGSQIQVYSLQRAASNILNNAIEAGCSQIAISISEQNGQNIEIEISNNGNPIPAVIRNKLFQERATFGKSDGTGLGLFQANKEITSFGGEVSLAPTERTSFVLSVPKEAKPYQIEFPGRVLILEHRNEIGNMLAQWKEKIDFISLSSLHAAMVALESSSDGNWTILVDLSFENGDETAFDFLEWVSGRDLVRVLVFSTVIDNPEIQKIVEIYKITLVERWRLLSAISSYSSSMIDCRSGE